MPVLCWENRQHSRGYETGTAGLGLAEARPVEGAGRLVVVYSIWYAGAAVPSLIAGQLARVLSLFDIALGYGALAGVMTLDRARNPRTLASS
jgi:hypothetical protein